MTIGTDDNEDEAEDFTPLRTLPEPIELVPPEAARSGYLVYRAKDGFEAAVPISVMERCVAWGLRAEPNEWFGLVVGKLCEHGGRTHVVVLGVVPDPDAKGRPHTVETTPESEFQTRTSARLLYPDGIVLGWVHGHIRHGVRFSATDRATQRTWSQPHALGIVVDPWTAERLSVYRGPNAERLKLVAASSPDDLARPKSPSLARRAAGCVASGAPRTARALAPLATLFIIAFLGLAIWRVDERLTELEAEAPRHYRILPTSEITDLQDRVLALEGKAMITVAGFQIILATQCGLMLDNPELVTDLARRESLTRSCAAALAAVAPSPDDAGVCTPEGAVQGGAP